MISVSPLENAPFGAEILGFDARDHTDDELKTVVDALHEHRFVVIRDQQGLSMDEYLAFGEEWGRPHPHVLDHLRLPGYPGIMAIGNTMEKDKDDSVRNGAHFWHSDQSYEAEPASATMLYAVKVPKTGGETQLVDLYAAYKALDDATRKEIKDKVALHLYGASSGTEGENKAAPIINDRQRDAVPAVPHRLARPHPVTGRVSLYAVSGTPFAVEGMAEDEGGALLAKLKRHALDPRFRHLHKYRVGDIVIWDNAQTLHSAVPIDVATCDEDSRLLYRISVKGRPRVCQ
jgi:taurine dioxygenase